MWSEYREREQRAEMCVEKKMKSENFTIPSSMWYFPLKFKGHERCCCCLAREKIILRRARVFLSADFSLFASSNKEFTSLIIVCGATTSLCLPASRFGVWRVIWHSRKMLFVLLASSQLLRVMEKKKGINFHLTLSTSFSLLSFLFKDKLSVMSRVM